MQLLNTLLPQAKTIAVFGVFRIFNETVLKDRVSRDLWVDILR